MLFLCVLQATTLLTMDKYSMQDVQNIHNTCFKLNSLQLHALMTNYHCAPDEPYIPPVRLVHTDIVSKLRLTSFLSATGLCCGSGCSGESDVGADLRVLVYRS